MSIKRNVYVYLFIGIMSAALWPVVLELAVNMDILEFTLLAYAVAVPVSIGFARVLGKKFSIRQMLRNKTTFLAIVVIGILNYGFQTSGMLLGEHFISASLAAVLFRTYPLLMLPFLPLVLKEHVSKIQIFSMSLGVAGMFLAFSNTLGVAGSPSSMAIGIAAVLVVAFTTAFSLALVKKYVYNTENAIVIFNIISLAFFGLAFLAAGAQVSALNLGNIGAILYVGIISDVIAAYAYYVALKTMKTTVVTNFYFLVPFITFALAFIFLGEPIEWYYIVIAFLITAGVFIQRFDKTGGAYLASKAEKLKKFVIFDVSGAFENTGNSAIAAEIENGNRVLAIKIPNKHREKVMNFVSAGNHANVFTHDNRTIPEEGAFVKEVVGAGDNDLVLMKAGRVDKSEDFFAGISELIYGREKPQ